MRDYEIYIRTIASRIKKGCCEDKQNFPIEPSLDEIKETLNSLIARIPKRIQEKDFYPLKDLFGTDSQIAEIINTKNEANLYRRLLEVKDLTTKERSIVQFSCPTHIQRSLLADYLIGKSLKLSS